MLFGTASLIHKNASDSSSSGDQIAGPSISAPRLVQAKPSHRFKGICGEEGSMFIGKRPAENDVETLRQTKGVFRHLAENIQEVLSL